MTRIFSSWKTTSSGILLIVASVTGLVFAVINHQVDQGTIMACATGILGGLGLIFAKDGNVTGGTVVNTQPGAASITTLQAKEDE